MERLLQRLYFDKRSPAYLAGKGVLYRVAKRNQPSVTLQDVSRFLARQNTYTLHKPIRWRFPRNKVIATRMDSHWQADLCDMRRLKAHNSHYQYILTVVDVLSKYGWAEPIKRKTPEEVTRAFRRILDESGRKPSSLMTDRGNEFKGCFQRFLKERDIHFYFAPNPVIKAPNVERYNRTLKNKIWRYFTEHKTKRYIGVLPDIVRTLNHSISRPIMMRPVDVNKRNQFRVWERLYRGCLPRMFGAGDAKYKFKLGDRVRVARWRKIFDKGYTPTFSKEVYTVCDRVPRRWPVYKLQDDSGEQLNGVFYAQQLQLSQ